MAAASVMRAPCARAPRCTCPPLSSPTRSRDEASACSVAGTRLGRLAHAHDAEAGLDQALHDVVCGCVGVRAREQLPHGLTAGAAQPQPASRRSVRPHQRLLQATRKQGRSCQICHPLAQPWHSRQAANATIGSRSRRHRAGCARAHLRFGEAAQLASASMRACSVFVLPVPGGPCSARPQ